jgi:glycosyltransferase involved in cell wall biosynthesis
MLKITFLIRSLNYGGVERQLVTLAKALSREQFDVSVLYFYAGGGLERELTGSGIKALCLDKRGRWDVFCFFVRLVKSTRRLRPDVLHAYLDIPNLLSLLLKPFCSSSRIVWGIRASGVSRFDRLTLLAFHLERFLARFADLIIVNSQAGRAFHVEKGFPAEKMIVIHNGIDVERFKPDALAGERVRREWGLSAEMKLIGIVGRLDPIKGHRLFLQAAALLGREMPEARFICIGEGPEVYERELRALARALSISEKLIWAGPRADMHAAYNAFDVATSASEAEGFPNVIGEAMACGVPCVVTGVGEATLIVGDTGRVVPPHDPPALAAAWRHCLEQRVGKVDLKARSRVVEHFSLSRLVERTTRALHGLGPAPSK